MYLAESYFTIALAHIVQRDAVKPQARNEQGDEGKDGIDDSRAVIFRIKLLDFIFQEGVFELAFAHHFPMHFRHIVYQLLLVGGMELDVNFSVHTSRIKSFGFESTYQWEWLLRKVTHLEVADNSHNFIVPVGTCSVL